MDAAKSQSKIWNGYGKAVVWKRNKHPLAETAQLLDLWRRRLCEFIGVAQGPGLQAGAILRA